jgi:hypothetical protein
MARSGNTSFPIPLGNVVTPSHPATAYTQAQAAMNRINYNKVVFDITEDKIWTDDDGLLHRDNGPAIQMKNGKQEWFKHGKRHRLDGPAIIYKNYDNDNNKWWIEDQEYSKDQWKESIKELLPTNEVTRILLMWT